MSHEHCCPKCNESVELVKVRNENTKVWIQSDTQCREHANKLEIEVAQLRAEVTKLKADWNMTAKFTVANAVRDTECLRTLYCAVSKLSLGWLYWPAKRQPDVRITMYESKSLDEIEKMSVEAIAQFKRDSCHA
jgi:hypothetical protein